VNWRVRDQQIGKADSSLRSECPGLMDSQEEKRAAEAVAALGALIVPVIS